MTSTPKTTIPFVSQGSKEALLSSELLVGIPITILGSRLNTTIKGPALYARETASPYKARPFMSSSVVINPTNTTNATIDIADADAVKFKVGDLLTYWDVSVGALYTGAALTLDVIGAAGSGGTGETLLTFTGEVWTTPPIAGDLLVVADGTELARNALVVLEDVAFNGVTEFLAIGYISGIFNKALVAGVGTGVPVAAGTTYYDMTKSPNLQFIDIV